MALQTIPFIANAKLHLDLIFKINYRENRLSFFYALLVFNLLIPLTLSIVFYLIIFLLAGGSSFNYDTAFSGTLVYLIVMFLYGIFALLVMITAAVRRLHDLGQSGWVALWVFLASVILSFVYIGSNITLGFTLYLGFNLYLLLADTKAEAHRFSELSNPFLIATR